MSEEQQTNQVSRRVQRWRLYFYIVLALIILYYLYKALKVQQKIILVNPEYGFRLLDRTMTKAFDYLTS